MSQSNIEKFYNYVVQNPALLTKLTEGVQAEDEFIGRAVAAAADQGMPISRDEAKAWIDSQIAARKSGELSDTQLEAVAGGKGGSGHGGISIGGQNGINISGSWAGNW